jgi:integrase
MAHVEKRGPGRYRVRHRLPDGRERSKTFTKKLDADRYLAQVESQKAVGDWIDPALGKIPLSGYAESWLAGKVDIGPRTRVNIAGRLRNHVLPSFGDWPVNQIRPSDVRAWVITLADAGLSPSTVRATYQALSQVLATAVVDGLIVQTPCRGIPLPKDSGHDEMHFLSHAQVADLASTVTPQYRAVVLTAAYTGMRAAEIHGLRPGAVDMDTGAITVDRTVFEVGGQLQEGPTKNGKARTIFAPMALMATLGQHLEDFPAGDCFFTSAQGGPIRHRNFMQRHFVPATKLAKTVPDDLRFHDLRHTCAALLISNGQHIEEIKHYLGHSSIRVTSDRYGHLFPEGKKALQAGLDALFVPDVSHDLASSSRPELEYDWDRELQREALRPPEQVLPLERTTRFELATLTLAR